MRITLERVSRRPPWPFWAVVLVIVWIALGSTTLWLSYRVSERVEMCLFKRLTGYPCPTCGSTRGVMSIVSGDIPRAWQHNPLVLTVLTVWAVMLVLRVGFKRAVRFNLTLRQRRIVFWAFICLILANWAYVIAYADKLPPPPAFRHPAATAPARK